MKYLVSGRPVLIRLVQRIVEDTFFGRPNLVGWRFLNKGTAAGFMNPEAQSKKDAHFYSRKGKNTSGSENKACRLFKRLECTRIGTIKDINFNKIHLGY